MAPTPSRERTSRYTTIPAAANSLDVRATAKIADRAG
jgi:hypothetical protein